MLQAKMPSGSLITLATLTRAEIDRIKKEKQKFYCPACGKPVIIKAGLKMVPHFAHRSLSDCPAGEGGEGTYHEQGKLLLYRWLMSQKLDAKLETYLPQIEQRPDILIHLNSKRIAIEYQCARIPSEQIHMRNQGYKEAGITPIWILGASRFERQTANHFKMDQMTLQLAHQYSSVYPQMIYYFCPYTLQLIRLNDIYLTKKNQAIARIKVNRLNELTFKDLFHPYSFSLPNLYRLWKKEKYYFRLRQKTNIYGNELAWRQWLYAKGTHLEYLPSIIYLPVASQYRMKTPVWDWQSRICLEIIEPLETGSIFSFKACEYLLRKQIHPPRFFPLIHSKNNPIEEYFQLLIQLKLLKPITPFSYQKIQHIPFHKHIENAIEQDKALMDHLICTAKKKIKA